MIFASFRAFSVSASLICMSLVRNRQRKEEVGRKTRREREEGKGKRAGGKKGTRRERG